MDLGLIIAIVGSAMAIVGVMIALFLWVRGDSNADRRDVYHLVMAIQIEMKDFHERLLKIEMSKHRGEK